MMRTLLYVFSALAVMGLAFWAYTQNYRTHEALREAQALQRDIAAMRESLGVLRAEWAYLNRPDRLRDLVELNYDRLGLMPMRPEHFGEIAKVAYPMPDLPPVLRSYDVMGRQGAPADGEAAE